MEKYSYWGGWLQMMCLELQVVLCIGLFEENSDGLVEPFVFCGGAGLLHLLVKTLKAKEAGNIAITQRNF